MLLPDSRTPRLQGVEGALHEQQRLAKQLASKGKALAAGPPASVEEARDRLQQLAAQQDLAAEAAGGHVLACSAAPHALKCSNST